MIKRDFIKVSSALTLASDVAVPKSLKLLRDSFYYNV